MKDSERSSPEGFSLVVGGPLYQLYLRCRLSRPALELLTRRIIVLVVITWFPLLVFSALEGNAIGGVHVPFAQDVSAHTRFLLALPLLIGAEIVVHGRIRAIVEQFKDRGLIAPQDEPRFQRALQSAMHWRDSVAAECIILLLSFTLGYWVWSQMGVLGVPTWYGYSDAASSRHVSPAGYWFTFISLPLLRFILLRWYFRIFIWYRFLWSVSRLKLRLNPLHPDRCGGLGFLTGSAPAFLTVLVAHSTLFAGLVGNWIWHEGAALLKYDLEIGALVVGLIAFVLAPTCFFAGQLHQARRAGIRRYGVLAKQYVDDFQKKWFSPAAAPPSDPLLGTADIQSLADLGNSFEAVRAMRWLPFGKETVIQLAIMILLPFSPLLLTMIPLRELLQRLVKIVV